MTGAAYGRLREALEAGRSVRSVTVLDGDLPPGAATGTMWVEPWDEGLGAPLAAVTAGLSARRPTATVALEWAPGRSCRVLAELHEPSPRLLLLGAGHIARALAFFGSRLGFRVTVYDDLVERLEADAFPAGTTLVAGAYGEAGRLLAPSALDWAVVVTRGHDGDYDALVSLAEQPLAYLGMIGSRRKVGQLMNRARAAGVSEAALERVWSPVGLDIGAETPEEIAVAILAEMVALRRGTDPTQVGSCRGRGQVPCGSS